MHGLQWGCISSLEDRERRQPSHYGVVRLFIRKSANNMRKVANFVSPNVPKLAVSHTAGNPIASPIAAGRLLPRTCFYTGGAQLSIKTTRPSDRFRIRGVLYEVFYPRVR